MGRSKRIDNLIEYVSRVSSGEDGKTLYLKFKDDLEAIESHEAFEVFYNHMKSGVSEKEILTYLDKVINVFYKSLLEKKPDIQSTNMFLDVLDQENTELLKAVDNLKLSLAAEPLEQKKTACLDSIQAMSDITIHFQKKENILFPYLEKAAPQFTGISIMWALHDHIKNLMKVSESVLLNESTSIVEVNHAVASLIFGLVGLVKKERLILFPTAVEVIDRADFERMYLESFEYGFAFIEEPQKPEITFGDENGHLEFEEIMMIFNTLPVDLTYVDADNKVRFFSKPNDRIFPRSASVIGRDVKHCHPPHSVHVVEEILEAFKSGDKNQAEFWIDLKGRKLHIRYFALRNSEGIYKGTLEVSQDITEIQEITGQRRLLEWEKEQ